jgi:predicted amidohydrolase YtcJ
MIIKNCNCYNIVKANFERVDLQINNNGIIINKDKNIISKDSEEEIFDLENKYLYPGFIDSHVHLVGTGQKIKHPSIDMVRSTDELKEIIDSIDEPLIMLRGWNEENTSFFPIRSILDECSTKKPILLIRNCGHIATVNSNLIEMFDIKSFGNSEEYDLEKGIIKGKTLEELKKMVKMNKSTLEANFKAGAKEFLKYGVTSVHSDDWYSTDLDVLMKVLNENKLIRVYEKIYTENFDALKLLINRNKNIFNIEKEFLNIKAIKIYLDGSLGSRTAYLKHPYADDKSTNGNIYFSEEELSNIIRTAEENGIQVMAHIIGDYALDIALKAFEKNMIDNNPLRHRIIHLQVASKEQLKKIKKLNLYVSIQPIFFESDYNMAIKRLGAKRFASIGYKFSELLELGINFSLSTDSPIESLNPFLNIKVAEKFMPRKEAFYRYTLSGAKSSFQENKVGSLEVGNFADAFVLPIDIFKVSENELNNILPEKVLFNGKWL